MRSSRWMRAVLASAATVFPLASAVAVTPSIVVGRVLSQDALDGPVWACAEPTQELCMSIWFRWTIRVERTLSGPVVTGRIALAHRQHDHFVKSYLKQFRLFVLTPIEDAHARQVLKADYYLEDLSRRLPMYCLDKDPETLGLVTRNGTVAGDKEANRYCFEDPETLPKD